MRKLVAFAALAVGACQPQSTQSAVVAPASEQPGPREACRDDGPDCVAACALRETHRTEYVDFYQHRCEAVIAGKNPDKVPLPASLGTQRTSAPFDPAAVTRTGGKDTEPVECKAARILRAQKRDHDADMLTALCVAKGGDAGI